MDYRGWICGQFIKEDSLRKTEGVEVKWGVHKKGEERGEWGVSEKAMNMAVLVRGKMRIIFPDEEVVLIRGGDYVMWGSGLAHKWRVEEDTTVVTIRWPSC